MASSRIISRLLVPTTVGRLSMIGNTSGPVRHFFNRNPRNLPDIFLGSTSNVFRDFDREFDRMQRQFDNYFRGNITNNDNRSLINSPQGGTNGKFIFHISNIIFYYYLESDMIVTESDGTRKFQLAFDMRGFEPEEVKIKTQNGSLIISAKKEKKV
jgi:HSP20 family molecular chaperone IbpA